MNRSLTLFIVALISLLTVGVACSAPGAELLESPIIDDLQTGIDDGDQTFDHTVYDELLDEHVDLSAGTVDYSGLQQDQDRLDDYLQSIADADLTTIGEDEQLALLLNAYNAYTLALILEHYPDIESIRDISNPWTTERYGVGGYPLSLDQIEHNIIRPLYRDPRIHFAVNCAARDCPFLSDFAYTGAEIDDQLQQRSRAILSNEQFVRVDDGQLRYTRVIHWYRDDFVDDQYRGHRPNVAQYIRGYASDDVVTFIDQHDGDPPTSPLDYDWTLNDSN